MTDAVQRFVDAFPVSPDLPIQTANLFGWLSIGAALGVLAHNKLFVTESCATTNPLLISRTCARLIESTNQTTVVMAGVGVTLWGASFVAMSRREAAA